MKGLGKRVLTALVAIPLLIGLIGWTPWYGFASLVVLAIGACLWELFNMLLSEETPAMRRFAIIWGLLTTVGLILLSTHPPQYGFPDSPSGMVVLLASMFGVFVVFLFARGTKSDLLAVSRHASAVLFGIFFLSLCGAHIAYLSILPDGLTPTRGGWVFLALAATWMGDTGAYFFGVTIGGPKLYPAVSPKKTWAGLVGCIVGATLGAFAVRATVLPPLTVFDCLLIGPLVAIIGQTGDFFESLLKRAHQVKDASSLLPGHGGLLDRIDALLLTGPFIYYYASWFVLTR